MAELQKQMGRVSPSLFSDAGKVLDLRLPENLSFAAPDSNAYERILRTIYGWGIGSPAVLSALTGYGRSVAKEACWTLARAGFVHTVGEIRGLAHIKMPRDRYLVPTHYPGLNLPQLPKSPDIEWGKNAREKRTGGEKKFETTGGYWLAAHQMMALSSSYTLLLWLKKMRETHSWLPENWVVYPETVLRKSFNWLSPVGIKNLAEHTQNPDPDWERGHFISSLPDALFVADGLHLRVETQISRKPIAWYRAVLDAIPPSDPVLYIVPDGSDDLRAEYEALREFVKTAPNMAVVQMFQEKNGPFPSGEDGEKLLALLKKTRDLNVSLPVIDQYNSTLIKRFWVNTPPLVRRRAATAEHVGKLAVKGEITALTRVALHVAGSRLAEITAPAAPPPSPSSALATPPDEDANERELPPLPMSPANVDSYNSAALLLPDAPPRVPVRHADGTKTVASISKMQRHLLRYTAALGSAHAVLLHYLTNHTANRVRDALIDLREHGLAEHGGRYKSYRTICPDRHQVANLKQKHRLDWAVTAPNRKPAKIERYLNLALDSSVLSEDGYSMPLETYQRVEAAMTVCDILVAIADGVRDAGHMRDYILYPDTILKKIFGWHHPDNDKEMPQVRETGDGTEITPEFRAPVPSFWVVGRGFQFSVATDLHRASIPAIAERLAAAPDHETVVAILPRECGKDSWAYRRLKRFEEICPWLVVFAPYKPSNLGAKGVGMTDITDEARRLLAALNAFRQRCGVTRMASHYFSNEICGMFQAPLA